ncbi:hypothetical protein AXK57_04490 [Tsukamurella pulmonis]|uniref:DUF3806 domain-containing protein n=1 Tax=Tsukamurella pulmonis TaxID=47312 RepID=A0A1H1GEK0_9ACTN|nr:hypothetical protein [Tsukamurella pulmonis]KXO88466.1 hypothetical protein AXK56_10920 [Tsukamurella pulmonis]KXP13457.1 hypothetical protein AXK57_04490 [Tsukamurella pulmonis]RDH10654.1 hypothetical protein DVB88_16565 [Tsukamurella pulmonis]SDR11513.1 hypothetical protein SAMN04489765_3283 [Tsukamurella pulmonis]SUP17400.1 Uncharacterised protein [Tsukamurella pulmonis]
MDHEGRVLGPEWTGRALRIPAAPVAANAPALAAVAVEAARDVAGVELDYSPASLSAVDTLLDGFREPGSDAMAETIFLFGCYVGEVLVRNAGYAWVDTPEDGLPYVGPLSVVCGPPDSGRFASPINKVFKRVDEGEGDSVSFFYEVFGS